MPIQFSSSPWEQYLSTPSSSAWHHAVRLATTTFMTTWRSMNKCKSVLKNLPKRLKEFSIKSMAQVQQALRALKMSILLPNNHLTQKENHKNPNFLMNHNSLMKRKERKQRKLKKIKWQFRRHLHKRSRRKRKARAKAVSQHLLKSLLLKTAQIKNWMGQLKRWSLRKRSKLLKMKMKTLMRKKAKSVSHQALLNLKKRDQLCSCLRSIWSAFSLTGTTGSPCSHLVLELDKLLSKNMFVWWILRHKLVMNCWNNFWWINCKKLTNDASRIFKETIRAPIVSKILISRKFETTTTWNTLATIKY